MRISASLFLAVLFLTACSGAKEQPPVQPKTMTTETASPGAVARINGLDVTLEEVDRPIELALYDLEWQKYQLRRESLKRIADLRGGHAELFLKPPPPPRLSIDYGDRPIRGASDAPVVVSVFCAYQSSHCARLQPVLEQLRHDNGAHMALAYFDFPQGFHRYGMDAANAARCAFESKTNWEFLDSLFGIYDDLNFDRFSRLAIQTGVTPNSFRACYEDRKFQDDIIADMDYAKSLGFVRVPTVLINGLYVKGPQTAEAYQFYIDQELDRLGVPKAAAINAPEDDAELTEDEDLTPKGLGYDRVRDVSNLPPRDKSQITLSRNWVNDQLRDESALMDFFYKGDHAPEGNHVLKLSDVSGHEFFETMGFRQGDVILLVNGDWVHENQNGLWNELRYSPEVEVKLMRRGKPVTYYYRFGD